MTDVAIAPTQAGPIEGAPTSAPPRLRAVQSPVPQAAAAADAERRLELEPYDLGTALTLRRELGIGHVLAQVLVRRGFTHPAQAREFLHGEVRHDPSSFAGIDRVTELISRHISAGNRIVVHGDYDVDGVCATAIMVRTLRSIGADVTWFIPDRLRDGYGVSAAGVERSAVQGASLLLTVDCGITASEELEHAARLGLDTIVTDHHAPPASGRLPGCPVLHPGLCGYPCADLCGTGVAYKLAQALNAPGLDDELELVALATVADLMPLLGENRTLVRAGLGAMAGTSRPGLRSLMSIARVDPSALDAGMLGFRLAPRINAAGRLRRADAAVELLLTDDQQRAQELAAELDALNAERRAVEQRTLWEAEAQVSELGARSAFVLAAEGWHPGVIGIVASRLVEAYQRPAILIALGADGIGHGSGRGIPGFDLLGALHVAGDHMVRYGGHRAAAGLTIRAERVDEFRAAIERHAEEVLTADLLSPRERVDAVVSGQQLGLDTATELELLEPCGIGNPAPRLLIPGARFSQVRAMGEGRHARFAVASGGTLARAVAFGCEGRLGVDPGDAADATFRLERNVWNGAVEPRLVLRRARACEASGIELVGEDESYLAAALRELERELGIEVLPQEAGSPDGGRTVLDRRGESPLAVLADVRATRGSVLAVCAETSRRMEGLRARTGGFALTSHHALQCGLIAAHEFEHIVVLDPPSSEPGDRLLRAGTGFTHLSWGDAELRFAQQMHELEYGLRTSLAGLYRSLRQRQHAAGEELERLLRGDLRPGRPARLAGRLIRVLAELGLVSLDRDVPALAIAGSVQTALERSPAFIIYTTKHEDGRRFLSSLDRSPSG